MTDSTGLKTYMTGDTWPYGEIEFIVSNGATTSYRRGTGELDGNGHPVTQMHRTDGPAFIWYDGELEWWVYDRRILSYKQYREASGCSVEDIVLFRLKYGDIQSR